MVAAVAVARRVLVSEGDREPVPHCGRAIVLPWLKDARVVSSHTHTDQHASSRAKRCQINIENFQTSSAAGLLYRKLGVQRGNNLLRILLCFLEGQRGGVLLLLRREGMKIRQELLNNN